MKPARDNHDDSQRGPSVPLRYASLGLELAASIVGLTLLGLWVDYKFESSPIGVLVGAGLGVVGGMYNLIRAALQMNAGPPGPGRTDRPRDTEKHDQH